MWSFFSRVTNCIIEPKEEMHIPNRRLESTALAEGALRTKFESGDCKTIAYPSSGGIVLGYFTGAELEWLGLSHSDEAKRCIDPHKEDAIAFQMLRLGALWWPSWKFYSRHSEKMAEIPYRHHFPPNLYVGYPSTGGVWTLKTADNRIRLPGDAEERPEDWTKVVMACTVDERCAMLERFGATFYADVEECPDVPKSLEEGIEMGRQYEGLLKKMEDDAPGGYLDMWLVSL
jgi:hypothetical protein